MSKSNQILRTVRILSSLSVSEAEKSSVSFLQDFDAMVCHGGVTSLPLL